MSERTLRSAVDALLTPTDRSGANDTLGHETVQRVADVGGRVVGIETLVEVRRRDLCRGTLGAEAEKGVERKLAARLDASFLVDGDATAWPLLHAGVMRVVRPTF